MDNELVIRFADVDDINTIGFLAQQIWPTAYGAILRQEQIDYMLNLFYSPDALVDQMKKLKHSFVLAELGEEPVGFASFGALDKNGLHKLHKLYVLPGKQGKGLGKALLDFIIEEIKTGHSNTKGPNIKSPDTKGRDTKGPDTKSPDTNGPDTKGPDTKSPDTKGPDTKGPDTKGPHQEKPILLRLGVNRFNPALNFYERLGFAKIKEEKTDIGNGFIMDDYIMELKIS